MLTKTNGKQIVLIINQDTFFNNSAISIYLFKFISINILLVIVE